MLDAYHGLIRLSYNPYFSACFFSRDSVFLSQQISRNSISPCFFSEANGAFELREYKAFGFYKVPTDVMRSEWRLQIKDIILSEIYTHLQFYIQIAAQEQNHGFIWSITVITNNSCKILIYTCCTRVRSVSCSNKSTLGAIGPEMCAGPRNALLCARPAPRGRPPAVARRESRKSISYFG